MKKTLQLIFFFFLVSWSVDAQNFIRVIQSDFQGQISISPDEALEVKLPSVPSSGFGWYPKNLNERIIKQVGASEGTAELELLYKRSWESESEALDVFRITVVVSRGVYTGKKIQPIVHTSTPYLLGEETVSVLPAAFNWQSSCTSVKNQR